MMNPHATGESGPETQTICDTGLLTFGQTIEQTTAQPAAAAEPDAQTSAQPAAVVEPDAEPPGGYHQEASGTMLPPGGIRHNATTRRHPAQCLTGEA